MPQGSKHPAGRAFRLVPDALTAIAAVCLVGMIGLITVDTVLGNLFGIRIFGAYEIVGILMAPVAFLPMARTLLRGGHLTVEIIDSVVSARSVHVLRILGLAGTFLFASMLAVFMYAPMMDAVSYGEVSPDRGIPVIVKLAPIFIAMGAAAIGAACLLIVKFRAVARPARED